MTLDLLLSIAAATAGLAGVSYYVWAAVQAHRALAWPTVSGRIAASDVRVVPGRWRTYRPSVTYSYEVGNRSYTSRRIFFGQALFSTAAKGFAEKRRDQYQAGGAVRVHVHPDKPELAVLEPGIWPDQFLPAFFWVLLLALGILGVSSWARS